MRWPALILAALLAAHGAAVPARAETAADAARTAEAAAAMLREALAALPGAVQADDQVTALAGVVRGYETGLAALRAGLRAAAAREDALRARFAAQEDRLARVLGAMMALEQAPEAALLLHPAGAVATARAGMIVADIAPGLRTEAGVLQADLDEIAQVRALQSGAAAMLGEGLASVQEARRLMASAAGDRSSRPARFGAAPAELQALADSAASLDAFAAGVAAIEDDVGPPPGDFTGAQGGLPLPVAGAALLRAAGEADAAGIVRPGIVLATLPAALVSAPWPATIRFAGPLLDYGNVMIVEPARGYLLVLAGMAQLFGAVGDVVPAGEPLGLMGGAEPPARDYGPDFVGAATIGGTAGLTQTLYLELREDKETLDPAEWFVLSPVVQ